MCSAERRRGKSSYNLFHGALSAPRRSWRRGVPRRGSRCKGNQKVAAGVLASAGGLSRSEKWAPRIWQQPRTCFWPYTIHRCLRRAFPRALVQGVSGCVMGPHWQPGGRGAGGGAQYRGSGGGGGHPAVPVPLATGFKLSICHIPRDLLPCLPRPCLAAFRVGEGNGVM